jgi:hypothetical protein
MPQGAMRSIASRRMVQLVASLAPLERPSRPLRGTSGRGGWELRNFFRPWFWLQRPERPGSDARREIVRPLCQSTVTQCLKEIASERLSYVLKNHTTSRPAWQEIVDFSDRCRPQSPSGVRRRSLGSATKKSCPEAVFRAANPDELTPLREPGRRDDILQSPNLRSRGRASPRSRAPARAGPWR